jgi:prevent-host-death family protein
MPRNRPERKNDGASASGTERTEYSATEARDILGHLINRAGYGGERITITSRGKPVAVLVGPSDLAVLEAAVA